MTDLKSKLIDREKDISFDLTKVCKNYHLSQGLFENS